MKFLITLLVFSLTILPAMGKLPPMKGGENMAKICAGCHQSDTNMMRGFLKNIAYKSGTIQMNLLSRQEVVKFNDHTKVTNLNSLKDIKKYKKKGFRIFFTEEKGEKHAVLITRFDIMKTLSPKEKLSPEDFQGLLSKKGVEVFDVRPGFKYMESHIPGTKMLPAPMFDKFAKNLPKDKNTPIIFYGVGGCLSPTATLKTKSMGYTNVKVFTGGFPAWIQKNYSQTTPKWLQKANKQKIPYILVDTRDAKTFKTGHIKGALPINKKNIDKHLASFPKHKAAPIVVYGTDAKAVAKKIVAKGYKHVRILPMPYKKLVAAKLPVATGEQKIAINYVPKARPGTLASKKLQSLATKSGGKYVLVDVRNPNEYDKGSIPGAINIPADELLTRISELPKNKEPVFFCATGTRAEMAYNIFKNNKKKSVYFGQKISFKGNGKFHIKN